MRNQIATQIKTATVKAIESMEPYKAQADRYNTLVDVIGKVEVLAIKTLDKETENGTNYAGLKLLGIDGAKTYLNYFGRTQDLVGLHGKTGIQLVALIAKNL